MVGILISYIHMNQIMFLNKTEAIKEGLSYHERRIHNNQMFDLLHLYTKQFDSIIQKFHELEKASSFADQSQDNA
ncbi:hypothetical protein W677_00310 [Staphylococcus aureus VET0467R]|nr:hypothetical protein W677_00310 [Staphylococcus aureus VET0467R]